MTLQEFADKYKVKIKKDECGDEIVPGKLVRGCGPERPSCHHHIYPTTGGMFAVYLNFPTKGRFRSAQRQLVVAGCSPAVVGEMDGILTFDPENDPLVKLVLKLTRVRAKRQLTEEQKLAVRQKLGKEVNFYWEGEELLDGRPCSLPGAFAEALAEGIEAWLTGEEEHEDDLRRVAGPDK